jgi:acetate kinase
MRTLLESDTAEAAQAVDLFCYRAVREIGSLAAAIEGIDALVFTGGIGEHAAAVRERICRPLAWTGLTFDADANAACATRISSPDSRVAVCVIPTNEEWMIARHPSEEFFLDRAPAPQGPGALIFAGSRGMDRWRPTWEKHNM